MVLDLNWKDHPNRDEINGNLPKISEVVREKRLNFAAHCSRRQNKPVSEFVFWMPKDKELVPKGDQGWRIPSSLVKTLAWKLNLMQDRHCGESSSWFPTEVDESKVSDRFKKLRSIWKYITSYRLKFVYLWSRILLTLMYLRYFSLPFVHKGGPLGLNHFKYFPAGILVRNLHYICIHLKQP